MFGMTRGGGNWQSWGLDRWGKARANRMSALRTTLTLILSQALTPSLGEETGALACARGEMKEPAVEDRGLNRSQRCLMSENSLRLGFG